MAKCFDLEFDSISEMAAYLDSTSRLRGAGEFSIREQSERECPMTWEAAMECARNGGYWAEGAEKMVQGVADAAALRENYSQPVIEHDVAGFLPDVPAYLAGQPDCMMHYHEGDMTTAQLPTVSIGIGTFAFGVDSHCVVNRGVAVLSLVDAIEAVGYRCQVDYVGDSCEISGRGLKRIRVTLKRPQDHWNPGSIAFATAHAAMLRRLTVACLERDPGTLPRTRRAYGKGDNGYIEDYSIAFPYMVRNTGYETLPEALASVEHLARDFGLDVSLGGSA